MQPRGTLIAEPIQQALEGHAAGCFLNPMHCCSCQSGVSDTSAKASRPPPTSGRAPGCG